MRFLFVTYCFGCVDGQTLIGVYKRGLRIAMELRRRDHEVLFFCTGRDGFHDSLTEAAAQRLRFVDLPFEEPAYDGAEKNRAVFCRALKEWAPDAVVIGEAPLAGTLLESTLAAAELGIPLACLDNIYKKEQTKQFCESHGPMFDRIILSGPSSFHLRRPHRRLTQLPPYMESSPSEAREMLSSLGLKGRRLIAVLAYDRNVEQLGKSLVGKLAPLNVEAVFLNGAVPEVRERLGSLPPSSLERVRVIPPPEDKILFGLIQEASLAIAKCAFMQVTECLTLRTPVIGVYFPGNFEIGYLPKHCHRFAHSTTDLEGDGTTLGRAIEFLALNEKALRRLHDGTLGAVSSAADTLERLTLVDPDQTLAETEAHGMTRARIRSALRHWFPGNRTEILGIRSSLLRSFDGQTVYALSCHYSVDGQKRFNRLWGRHFESEQAARKEDERASTENPRRKVLFFDPRQRTMIEQDLGESVLPSLEDCSM